MRGKIRYLGVLLLAAIVSFETGCGGSSSSSYDSYSVADSAGITDSIMSSVNSIAGNAGSVSGASSSSSYDSSSYEESSYENDVESTGNEMNDSTNKKLIKNVNMSVETYEFTKLVEGIQNRVYELNGYIENYNCYNENSEGDRSAYMTIRIPAESLDNLVDQIDSESNVTSRSESIEDVTLTYTDLDSHKRMLQEEQDRLFELLQQAEDIETIIALESRLTDVRYQIDSIESQLRVIDNQVSYSTIELDVYEVERYTPQTEKGTWDRIRVGFTENLYKVGDGIKEFFIWFIVSLPIICIYALVIAIIIIILMFIVKKSDKIQRKRMEQQRRNQTGLNIPSGYENMQSTKVRFQPNTNWPNADKYRQMNEESKPMNDNTSEEQKDSISEKQNGNDTDNKQ